MSSKWQVTQDQHDRIYSRKDHKQENRRNKGKYTQKSKVDKKLLLKVFIADIHPKATI